MSIDYRDLLQKENAWGHVLGVITCKILRRDEEPYRDTFERVCQTIATDEFSRFVERENLYLAATAGSYKRLDQSWRRFPALESRKCRVEASAPGIIQLANLVVFGFCRAVLFFNDSDDIYADSPQNLALRRLCNEFNVPLIEDVASIEFVLREWYGHGFRGLTARAEHVPAAYPQDALKAYFGSDSVMANVPPADRNRRNETLAIIAHDGKKMEMLRFCARHINRILEYRRILTTGTTGLKLRGLYAEILSFSDEVRTRFGVSKDGIEQFVTEKICPFKSGPAGGDIQISAKVVDGSCHRVIFFEDPQSAHPHQFDVRLLEKAVQSHSTSALFATSTEMAELIV